MYATTIGISGSDQEYDVVFASEQELEAFLYQTGGKIGLVRLI